MKKYYIAYENNIVWGVGMTAIEAKKDALDNLGDYYADVDENALHDFGNYSGLKTSQCTRELVDYVDTNSGENVPFVIKNGIATLKPLDKCPDLNDCIEESADWIKGSNPINADRQILKNQIAIMQTLNQLKKG